MSERPPVSVDPSASSIRRKRQRLFARIALAAALFLWPAILQIEKLTSRAESLKVLGQAGNGSGGGGAHLAAGHAPRHGYRRGGLPASAPNFGALREAPPSLLEAETPPLVTLASAQAEDFIPPFDFGLTAPSQPGPGVPFNLPAPGPFAPGLISGPSGPGGGPPVTNPPVVEPGGPNPPVTNPPVVDPGTPQPPVVTPPGNPPVQPPPPVTNPNPPVEGPTGGTFTPPGDPGGDPDPGGHNPPIPGVPEPSVWMELILGAGLAGAALRQARRQPVAIALRARSRRSPTT